MKKLFTFLLAGVMVLSLAACGGGEEESAEQTQFQEQTTAAAQQSEDNGGNTTAENSGKIMIKEAVTSFSRNDGTANVPISMVYSNKEKIQLEDIGEVNAADWGFSTTDTRRTLTTVAVNFNKSGFIIYYEGGTEEDFSIKDITYKPVEGKEIKTVQGEILEGFSIEVPYRDIDLY